MKETFLIGRLLAGAYFIFSGAHHFTDLAMLTRHAAAKGVPMAEVSVVIAGLLLLVGGISLLLGLAPKVGIAALVLFLIPVTLMMHQFWTVHGAARAMEMMNFTKNMGLLGAVMGLAAVPEPWPYSVHAPLHFPRRLRV